MQATTLYSLAPQRWGLLPFWIRAFSWLFLLVGVAATVLEGLVLVFPELSFSLQLGSAPAPSTEGELSFAASVGGVFSMPLLAVAAFGLLWGKRWGIDLGLAVALLGLGIAIYMTASSFLDAAPGSIVRLEPLVLVPFVVALARRRRAWLQKG